MFSLSDMVRMAMIPPPAPEHSRSKAGACSDWERVLHAFSTENLTRRIRWLASCNFSNVNVASAN
jgi:hypothetical protein